MNTCPPKSANNSVDSAHKGLGEEDSGHVVHQNGSNDILNVSEPASVVEFVGFDSG